MFVLIALYSKSALIVLVLNLINFIEQGLVVVTAPNSELDHVLTHSVVVGYYVLVYDCFSEFGLLQHLLQELVLLSQHPDQLIHIVLVHYGLVLDFLGPGGIP